MHVSFDDIWVKVRVRHTGQRKIEMQQCITQNEVQKDGVCDAHAHVYQVQDVQADTVHTKNGPREDEVEHVEAREAGTFETIEAQCHTNLKQKNEVQEANVHGEHVV